MTSVSRPATSDNIQNECNKRLHTANCCNIFQTEYTADLNSALYLYTGISTISVDFVCNLLLITVTLKLKTQLPIF